MTGTRKLSLEALRLLATLASHERSLGADLAKLAELKRGTVYPLLTQLSGRGLVLAEVEGFASERTFFSLTGNGRAELRAQGGELVALLAAAFQVIDAPAPKVEQHQVVPEKQQAGADQQSSGPLFS